MRWCVVLLVALVTNAKAFELDPVCHEYYEMIQSPDLTYEDVGRIAEAMYQNNCWPAMQQTPPAQTAGGLPSCEYLAEQLVSMSDNVRKLFEVRPMRESDCGELFYDCEQPDRAGKDYCTREVGNSVIPIADTGWTLTLAQCDLLVSNPVLLANQQPKHGLPSIGFRPVNCRGKILYADGSKSGFYFYMEEYSDGDRSVWGLNIPGWGW